MADPGGAARRFAGVAAAINAPSVVAPDAPWTAPADRLSETTIGSEAVFRGNFLAVNRDVARLPDGSTSTREFVLHPGASAMVPIADDERILIERQFRYAMGRVYVEIPAGKLDRGESSIETAKRELLEETGYEAARWAFLTQLHPAIGFSNELMDLFLARDLTQRPRQLDHRRIRRTRVGDVGLAGRRDCAPGGCPTSRRRSPSTGWRSSTPAFGHGPSSTAENSGPPSAIGSPWCKYPTPSHLIAALPTGSGPRKGLIFPVTGRRLGIRSIPEQETKLQATDVRDPDYFHRVVDCQWACPAHTPVPEYIRLIAAGRYGDAYLVNWRSNVFPGILGRTCDRPCEPACRRGRVEEAQRPTPEPVAICRLKRVAADLKDDIKSRLPKPAAASNGKRIACVGAGPASLTVARDLAPLGYEVTVFDGDAKAGGMIRTQIPRFRLPESVIDEEIGYVLDLGVDFRGGQRVDSIKGLLSEGYDAIFVGSGAPRGRDLDLPGRREAATHIHIGIDWLTSVSFGHTDRIGPRVIVLGGGNTAMDCCRTARRLGGEDVKVIVRSGFDEMKASPWEKEDAQHEGIPILNFLVPKTFEHDNGRLIGDDLRESAGRLR